MPPPFVMVLQGGPIRTDLLGPLPKDASPATTIPIPVFVAPDSSGDREPLGKSALQDLSREIRVERIVGELNTLLLTREQAERISIVAQLRGRLDVDVWESQASTIERLRRERARMHGTLDWIAPTPNGQWNSVDELCDEAEAAVRRLRAAGRKDAGQ